MADWMHLGCGGTFPRKNAPPIPCPRCGDKPTLTPGWRYVGPTVTKPKKLRKSGGVGRGKRKRIIERDGERCKWCGATERLEVDHIHPRSRGGNHALENLQLLCHDCNQAKGNSLEAEADHG